MSEYNTFLENVYSDESIPDHLEDIDAVQRMMAEEGYQEFSIELEQQLDEQSAWNGSKEVNGILIKKAWCATRREDGMSERFTTSSSIAHTGGR
jgi:hypothetical protein